MSKYNSSLENCDAKILLFDEKSKEKNKKSSTEMIFLTFYIYISLFKHIFWIQILKITDKKQCIIKCYI